MAPPRRREQQDDDDDEQEEITKKTSYKYKQTALSFKAKRRRGRPRKANTAHDPPPQHVSVVASHNDDGEEEEQKPPPKKKRVNWCLSPHKEIMEKAVSDWLNREGDCLDCNGEPVRNIQTFCNIVSVPMNTFKKFIHKDPEKRRKIGDGVGRPPLLPRSDQKFAADICARRDRGNDGLERKDLLEYLQEIKPGITPKQAENHYDRTLKKNHSSIIKTKSVAAQGTTTQRNAITVEQQFRWHKFIDSGIAFLRQKSTGICKCGCGNCNAVRLLENSLIILLLVVRKLVSWHQKLVLFVSLGPQQKRNMKQRSKTVARVLQCLGLEMLHLFLSRIWGFIQ